MYSWLGPSSLLSAADDDKIVTTANMKVGTYTIAAQPTVPSLISVKATASGTADTMGKITIAGTVDGATTTEEIVPVAGSTVWGAKYFSAITSVTGSGWVIDAGAGNDTIIVGVGMESSIAVSHRVVTVISVLGNVYINPNETAVADATSILLSTGQSIDVLVDGRLSLISDGSGATVQYIVWDV
jgi:hypothetical protein